MSGWNVMVAKSQLRHSEELIVLFVRSVLKMSNKSKIFNRWSVVWITVGWLVAIMGLNFGLRCLL